MSKNMKIKKGFTLIELLVVMAIIMILAGILFVRFNNAQRKARDATRKADLKEIQNAIEIYADDHNGLVPNHDSGVNIDVLSSDLSPTYVSIVPDDPKAPDRHYRYLSDSATASKKYILTAELENPNEQVDCTDTWDCPTAWSTAVIEWTGGGSVPEGIYFRLGNG